MSEDIAAGAESAPASTADVASEVIDAFDATETTATDTGDTPAPAGPPPVAEPPKTPSEVEALMHEAGFTEPRRPDGRENRIPYSKVQRIVENARKKAQADFDARASAVEGDAKTLREQIERLRAGVAGDTRAFLEDLASVDPRYRAFLEQAAAAPAPVVESEMPRPDIRLPDGSSTYSLDGIQKLLEWKTAQVEAKIDAKLKPFAERDQRERERQQTQQIQQQVTERSRQQIDDAKTWPGFAEHEDAILAALQADSQQAAVEGRRPGLSLDGAYRQVVIPRLTEDDNKKRERLLKELQSAPRSTSVPRTGGEAPRTPSGASTADIAARTLERLERAGS